MRLVSKLSSYFDHVLNLLSFLACALVSFMTIIICMDVVSRQFFNKPTIWVTEICEYSLLWITFFGTAWLLREEGHIRIDLFERFLNEKQAHLLAIFNSALGAMISLVITWFSAVVVLDFYRGDVLSIEMLGVPRYIVLGPIPITCFLLFLQFLRSAHGHFRQWQKGNNNQIIEDDI